jgi:hypothetical protein
MLKLDEENPNKMVLAQHNCTVFGADIRRSKAVHLLENGVTAFWSLFLIG